MATGPSARTWSSVEGVAGQDKVHGYTETPVVPGAKGDFTATPGVSVSDLQGITDSTITIKMANGTTFTLSDAWANPAVEINTTEGRYADRVWLPHLYRAAQHEHLIYAAAGGLTHGDGNAGRAMAHGRTAIDSAALSSGLRSLGFRAGAATSPTSFRNAIRRSRRTWARRAGRYQITGYIICGPGVPDYRPGRDALMAACDAYGPGTLVHPTLGTMQVDCDSWTVQETR